MFLRRYQQEAFIFLWNMYEVALSSILQERKSWKVEESSLIAFAIRKFVTNLDNALILGDACQVESKFLGEAAGFTHIDNVDSSPLVMDHYYDSDKMTPILSSFEALEIPENMYDFIHGKSVTFIEKDKVAEFLEKIKNGLKADGAFSSLWHLERNSVMTESNWEKPILKKIFQDSGFEIIYEKEIEGDSVNLYNEKSHRHEWGIVMKKEHEYLI